MPDTPVINKGSEGASASDTTGDKGVFESAFLLWHVSVFGISIGCDLKTCVYFNLSHWTAVRVIT